MEDQSNLYQVKLNSEAITRIFRLAIIIRVYLVIGILFLLVMLTYDIASLLIYEKGSDNVLNIVFILFPISSIISMAIFILQLIFFYRLSHSLKQLVKDTDEAGFNQVIENITKATWTAMLITVVSIPIAIFNVVLLFMYRA